MKRINEPPPVDDAERAIVAAGILAPHIMDDVCDLISYQDFRDGMYSDLWKILSGMHARNECIDGSSLIIELKKAKIDSKEQYYIIAEIVQDRFCDPYNAVYYAKQIRDRSVKSKLMLMANRLMVAACDPSQTSESVIEATEKDLTSLRDTGVDTSMIDARQLVERGLSALKERRNGKPPGIKFGFDSIDRLASLRPGQLWILAARPSVGKSAFAKNLACYHARNIPVGFFSLEMSDIELFDRIIANYANVNHDAVVKGTVWEDQWDRVVDAAADIGSWNLFVDEKSDQSVSHIASRARKLKRMFHGRCDGHGLIIVDYIQLINSELGKGSTRNDEVGTIARRLKLLARELKWPILCLAQLSRKADETDRPRLSHLRDSGEIEQHADCVMFLHRADVNRKESDRDGKAQAIIAKQRGGTTGDCNLLWCGEHVRFSNEPLAVEFDPYDFEQ